MATYECQVCGYRYVTELGDPDHHIPPQTPFEALDDSWQCPECGAHKATFKQSAKA